MNQDLTAVDYKELLDAVSRHEDSAAYVNQATGEVVVSNGFDSMLGHTLDGEELVGIPLESELGIEGSALALRFAETRLPKDLALVQRFFQRRNADRMFFGLVEAKGLGADWSEFQDDAREQALREWCSQHRLALTL